MIHLEIVTTMKNTYEVFRNDGQDVSMVIMFEVFHVVMFLLISLTNVLIFS